MDALTHILHFLRLKSSLYCRSELGAGWGLHFLPHPGAVFHVLYRGDGFLRIDGEPSLLPVYERDVLLLPAGGEHSLMESADAPLFRDLKLDQWGECALMRWSEQPAAIVLCGTFEFEEHDALSFFQHLPRVVRIPRNDAVVMNAVLDLMAREAEADRPGKEIILRRLADILFVQIIQHWVETNGLAQSGWLGAAHDPLVGKALALMHASPERDWTVASLARETACSRSTFAARFTALVGKPPLEYLTLWRMRLAARRLRERPSLSVYEIALQTGYRSEAAFSKAFKRELGVTPGAYRRQTALAR